MIGMIAASFLVLGGILFLLNKLVAYEVSRAGPEDIWEFVRRNRTDGRAALSIHCNGEPLVEVNEHVRMPLASTVKLLIAVEYARQAASGQIDPAERVPLASLASLHFPRTDGGAHAAWLKSVKADEKGTVPLSAVADGMITCSSNANTDYLLRLLGLEAVNDTITLFQLSRHDPIYPLVSTLFIPVRLMNEESISRKRTIHAVEEMDMNEYQERAAAIFNSWPDHPPTEEECRQMKQFLSLGYQKVWSDHLIRGTTAEYASILAKLNSKTFLSAEVHAHLDPIVESVMRTPGKQEWLRHSGRKSGSTAFVLTDALYATTKEGLRLECAFFADGLTPLEQARLFRSLNAFHLALLQDRAFREKLKSIFH